jgi:hypothetical protein
MRARLAGDEGSSLIELAVVLPVVMLLVLGLIDVCLILFGMGTANFAGRSALRYASMHSNTSYSPATQAQLSNIVKAFILPYPSNTFSVTEQFYSGSGFTSSAGSGNNVGLGVLVTVSISYQFNVMGYTFQPFSYSTTGASVIVE